MQTPILADKITTKEASAITGLSLRALYNAARSGYGPIPVKLSRRCLMWNKDEIVLYAKYGLSWREHITDVANHE